MNTKIRVGLVCGGVSCEHDVSLASAKNVLAAIDLAKYEVVPFFIDKSGKWHSIQAAALTDKNAQELLSGIASPVLQNNTKVACQSMSVPETQLDVVFPLLHGPFGEDGTIQGFLKLMKIPFVGASVLGSAVGMDKDVMKRLLRDAGLPIARFRTIVASHKESVDLQGIIDDLGLPLFVKPANMGSSLGIYKAKSYKELELAIAAAFEYDRKIVIEECIVGREVECAVLGNENPIASIIGEVVTSYEFYTYEAKYLDHDLRLEIPANILPETMLSAQKMAIAAFQTLCCEGMARVDFFLKENGDLIVNEINTIPGFTSASMYPKLWGASGIGYSELIDRLIELAIERHDLEKQIQSSPKN